MVAPTSLGPGPYQLFNYRDRKGLGPMRPSQLDAGKPVQFHENLSLYHRGPQPVAVSLCYRIPPPKKKKKTTKKSRYSHYM